MRRFAVVGSPIDHSLSPLLHRTAYQVLGISDADYGRAEVPPGGLADFLVSTRGRSLDGLSVTMPGKIEAFELADERDDISQLLGVSNTLLRLSGGGWRAENHDVYGIEKALRDAGVAQLGSRGPTAAVLGSGATAASAVAALARLGVRGLMLTARTRAKLDPLVDLAHRLDMHVLCVPWERSETVLASDVVVSALAAPGAEAVAQAWGDSTQADPRVALDVLYQPWPAPVAELLERRGSTVASGLEMLVHQADMQLRAMLGIDRSPVEAMLAAARAALY